MKWLAQWSIRNRASVDVLVLAWILGGIYAFSEIRREFFPEISMDSLRVVTVLPGATAEDIEALVTDPIEDAVVDLPGIDHVESNSAEGRSEIVVFVDPDASTVDEVRRDVERAVNLVDDLPAEAEDPQVIENKFEAPVLVAAILGDAPWETRKRLADAIEDRFREVPGVSSVVVAGLRDREIAVEVDPERLASRGLSAGEVADAIRAARADLPAGVLGTREGDVFVRTRDDLEDPGAVGEVVVRAGSDGWIRVRDVATVRETLADERTRSRVNGAPATILTVLKSREGDVIAISDRLKEILAEEGPRMPAGLSLTYVQDGSEWVRERLNVAYVNGLWGFFLVLIMLALFLDPASALWCAFGIPAAILGGLFVLFATGGTLNMLTIFGFILVVGMLVDDAIVVVENVARYREMGLSPEEAVVRGASEVARPVLAAVLTTIAALLPLALMTGIMGKFMAEIPKPGIYALLASLIEALVTLPAHLYATARWGRPRILARPLGLLDRVRGRVNLVMNWARGRHRTRIAWYLRHRYLFLSGMGLLFVATVVAAVFVLRFELVSTRDTPLFLIEIRAPAGTSLEEVERIVAQVEARVLTLPSEEIESISSTIGIRRADRGVEYGREIGQVMVDLQEPDIRPRNADAIIEDLRPRLADLRGAEVVIKEMRGGPPVGSPIGVRISGEDWKDLRALADEVKAFVAKLPGTTDIEDDLQEGKREMVIRPLPDALALAGATPARLALEARAVADGIEAASVRRGGEEVKIRVRFDPSRRLREADLAAIRIPTPSGPAPIANLARIESGRGFTRIRHYDGRRTVTVSADVARDGIESREASRRLADRFLVEARGRGLGLAFGGEQEETNRSLASIRWAGFVGISLIAIILVFEFGNFWQPFVVLGTLPLALIGVVATLILHSTIHRWTGWGMDTPMGLMPLIGLTALLGVIVNDAIVLIDFVNHERDRGVGRWRSILTSCGARLRPILLTSVTTIAGVLPLAYTARGSSAFLAPMALVFGWGLAFGTLLTLFVVPALLAVVDDVRFGFARFSPRRPPRRGPLAPQSPPREGYRRS